MPPAFTNAGPWQLDNCSVYEGGFGDWSLLAGYQWRHKEQTCEDLVEVPAELLPTALVTCHPMPWPSHPGLEAGRAVHASHHCVSGGEPLPPRLPQLASTYQPSPLHCHIHHPPYSLFHHSTPISVGFIGG